MGRPERPLDPDTGPLARFAHDLRQLRRAAGTPSYRQLAATAHFSATALSKAAAGTDLPSLEVTLAYVRACGGDPEQWRARWSALAAEPAWPRPEPVPGEPGRGQTWPGRRVALAAGAVGAAAALAVVAVLGFTAHGQPPARPPATSDPTGTTATAALPRPVAPPRAPAGKTIRKQGTTALAAGELLDLDTAPDRDWRHAEVDAASLGDYSLDIEFTAAYRTITSHGTSTSGASLAYIPHPTNDYTDCSTAQDYSSTVPKAAIRPGAEFCVITSNAHRSLVRITAVGTDVAGPDQVTLYLTTWSCVLANDVCR